MMGLRVSRRGKIQGGGGKGGVMMDVSGTLFVGMERMSIQLADGFTLFP